jgi:hypothetical protein
LKGDGDDKEIVGQLIPLIHSVSHVEQSERKGKVQRGFDVRDSSNGAAGPHEYTVEKNDEQLEDKDI